jgi:hypothetical protein
MAGEIARCTDVVGDWLGPGVGMSEVLREIFVFLSGIEL